MSQFNEQQRESHQSGNPNDGCGVGCSRGKSQIAGSQEPLSVNQPYSNGASSGDQVLRVNPNRETIVGGIQRQVRAVQQAYLAYVHSHRERLQKRLQESYEHEQNFLSEIQAINEQIRQLLESD